MDSDLKQLYNEVRKLNAVVRQIWIALGEHHIFSYQFTDSITKKLEEIGKNLDLE